MILLSPQQKFKVSTSETSISWKNVHSLDLICGGSLFLSLAMNQLLLVLIYNWRVYKNEAHSLLTSKMQNINIYLLFPLNSFILIEDPAISNRGLKLQFQKVPKITAFPYKSQRLPFSKNKVKKKKTVEISHNTDHCPPSSSSSLQCRNNSIPRFNGWHEKKTLKIN